MAKYLILIYGDAERWGSMSPAQQQAHGAAHAAFTAAAGSKIIGGEELELAPKAITVRTDTGGQVLITDGPFLETKEAVGGYYLLDAADLDEVTALATRLPEVHADHSGVEIRPVVYHA